LSGLKRARQTSSPGRRKKQRPLPGYGIFAQEPGRYLRFYADMPDAKLATEAAERLFDSQEDCELVLLWDYAEKQPRQVWRLTPTTLPHWEAQPEEEGEAAQPTAHGEQGSSTASGRP